MRDSQQFRNSVRFSRVWSMPSPDTLSIPPIAALVGRWARGVIVDPFARNSRIGTYTNDLNPATTAMYHMDAVDFLRMLAERGVVADTLIFDPPYSPRQISESYAGVGRRATTEDTQSSFWTAIRDAAVPVLGRPQSTVLSFGWNSTGMGVGRGYELREVLLVAHGGAHNDTICIVETRNGLL